MSADFDAKGKEIKNNMIGYFTKNGKPNICILKETINNGKKAFVPVDKTNDNTLPTVAIEILGNNYDEMLHNISSSQLLSISDEIGKVYSKANKTLPKEISWFGDYAIYEPISYNDIEVKKTIVDIFINEINEYDITSIVKKQSRKQPIKTDGIDVEKLKKYAEKKKFPLTEYKIFLGEIESGNINQKSNNKYLDGLNKYCKYGKVILCDTKGLAKGKINDYLRYWTPKAGEKRYPFAVMVEGFTYNNAEEWLSTVNTGKVFDKPFFNAECSSYYIDKGNSEAIDEHINADDILFSICACKGKCLYNFVGTAWRSPTDFGTVLSKEEFNALEQLVTKCKLNMAFNNSNELPVDIVVDFDEQKYYPLDEGLRVIYDCTSDVMTDVLSKDDIEFCNIAFRRYGIIDKNNQPLLNSNEQMVEHIAQYKTSTTFDTEKDAYSNTKIAKNIVFKTIEQER